jgi:hypothetical protein
MAETTEFLKMGYPYSPDEVIITINGKPVHLWSRVTVERLNPVHSWAPPSADGGHLAHYHPDQQGRITLELFQKSPSLQEILALASVKQPFSITVKDKSGTPDIATMPEALLENLPQLERGRAGTETTYRCSFIGVLYRVEGGVPE